MKVVSAHKCDIGRMHRQNDDYIWVDEAAGVFIVADGMGGHEAGDIASRMAADAVGSSLAAAIRTQATPLSETRLHEVMTQAIEQANIAVYSAAQKAEQKRRMGATIVVAVLLHNQVFISHAGDSRAYLARSLELKQLTEDDSWGAQFAAAGMDSGSAAGQGRFDHFLTKSVGQESALEPSFITVAPQPGDWLLLCSDGLWNMLDNEQILAELTDAADNPQQAVEALVDAANAGGGRDNISAIAIKFLP